MNNDPMADKTFSSLNVLVVDDEAFSQRFIARILGSLGVASVTTADNGAAGLERLAEADSPIDLIISDIEMPEMDGYEFVRRVRYGTVPEFKDVPILVLTGQDTDTNVQKARFHKIDGFVVKPPDIETMRRSIRRALGL